MRVAVVDPQPALFGIPCENGPTSRCHGTFREVFDKRLDGSVTPRDRADEFTRIFEFAVAAQNFEVPFMKVNAIDGVCFILFEPAQLAISRVAGFPIGTHDRAAYLFKTVFDFVLLFDIADVQLVMMVFDSAIRNAVQWSAKRQTFRRVVVLRLLFGLSFKILHIEKAADSSDCTDSNQRNRWSPRLIPP